MRKFKPIDERKAGLDVIACVRRYAQIVNELDRDKLVKSNYVAFKVDIREPSIQRKTMRDW